MKPFSAAETINDDVDDDNDDDVPVSHTPLSIHRSQVRRSQQDSMQDRRLLFSLYNLLSKKLPNRYLFLLPIKDVRDR